MKLFLLIALMLFTVFTYAQEQDLKDNAQKLNAKSADTTQGWKMGGMGSLTFAQVSLSNWAAGGQNSVALNAGLNLFANYKKGHESWDNTLDLGFGMVRQGTEDLRKSDDRIDFASKYGRMAFKSQKWYYAMLGNFRTQWAPGYNYPNDTIAISRFMAPGYAMIALGLDYKPMKDMSFFFSPVTSKFTFVNDQTFADAGAFGVEAAEYDTAGVKIKDGKRMRYELGGYLKFTYKTEITKSALFQTKLELFSNYATNPQNIDVIWENALVVKLGKYIGITFGTLLIYDHDVQIAIDTNGDGVTDGLGPRTQFRQLFGAGFSYKFSNK